MNILSLLIKEKHVAGVEISDRFIRIAYFNPKKKLIEKIYENRKKNTAKIEEHELVLIEEPIPADIIIEGVVVNRELLGKTIKDIWTKTKLNTSYAIVAIPEDKIYSHIFSFPKAVDEAHLREAVNLTIDFQLPFKKSDVYIGWENAFDSNALVSTIPKIIANNYIDALNYSGIKILALESHLASIARSIKLTSGQASLFTKRNQSGATVFILKDGLVHFSRTLPEAFIKEGDFLVNEAGHVKTSFESEKKVSVTQLSLNEATVKDEYLKYPELKTLTPELQSKWLVALGAAIRGEIPEGQDNRISLLPIGTVKAFAYQKTTTFTTLVRNMIVGVSIFFLFTFLAAYFFIFYLSQTAIKANPNISTTTPSPDMLQKEAWIKNINGITAASAVILSTTPIWSTLLDDISSRVVSGIVISNFSVTSINDTMSMTGIAKDRSTLNQFKKSLQASPYLTAVELPITNLEQKGDIPFSITFHIKDPSMLYYK